MTINVTHTGGFGTLVRCKDADVRDALQRIDTYAKSGLRASKVPFNA